MNKDNPQENEVPVLMVLQDIKNGLIKFLDQDDSVRKEIVNILRLEGQSMVAISQILKCSTKTIQRIKEEIIKDGRISSSPEFVKETIGEMRRVALHHWSSLTRIARSSSATTRDKISAEVSAWGVMQDLIEELRRLGYLPSATQEFVGTFSHKIDDGRERSWEEIQAEVIQLHKIAQETKVLTPDLEKELLALGQRIDKSSVEEKIKNISMDKCSSKEGETYEEE